MTLLEWTCELTGIVLPRPCSVVNFLDTVRGGKERGGKERR